MRQLRILSIGRQGKCKRFIKNILFQFQYFCSKSSILFTVALILDQGNSFRSGQKCASYLRVVLQVIGICRDNFYASAITDAALGLEVLLKVTKPAQKKTPCNVQWMAFSSLFMIKINSSAALPIDIFFFCMMHSLPWFIRQLALPKSIGEIDDESNHEPDHKSKPSGTGQLEHQITTK